MPFTGHPRASTPQWRRTRRRILTRDHSICHICHRPGADEVDHITPVAFGGTDHDTNLAAIHDNPCHRRKTAAEGNAARWRHKRKRPAEPHPGMLG